MRTATPPFSEISVNAVCEPILPATIGSRYVLGTRIDATSYDDASDQIVEWARQKQSKYVVISGVNIIMEGLDRTDLQTIVNRSALSTTDGMPLVWCLKFLGIKGTLRVTGPFLTPYILRKAAENGIPVGFYGGASQERLERLLEILKKEYPQLEVPYAWAPPFRPLSDEEDAEVRQNIKDSGVRILFVGLGCPKQERWVASHTAEFDGVMLGVGAAFDFIAGIKPMAPVWMQNAGLEWLYRLLCEPKRLWKRYLKQNPAFILLFLLQLMKLRKFRPHL